MAAACSARRCSDEWGMQRVGGPAAWDLSVGGLLGAVGVGVGGGGNATAAGHPTVTVCVIDSGGLGGVGRVDGQVCSTRSHMSFRLHMSFRSHMSFPLRTHLLTILRCRPSLLAEMALLRPWPAALSWRSLIWEPVTRVGGQNSISAYLHCANAYLTALAWTQLLRDDWRCLLHALCIIAWLQSLSTA